MITISSEDAMIEHEVKFRSGDLNLAGTLSPPQDGSGTAVLLVTGSGPIDRDSNTKRMPLDVTCQIARHLAENGIGSLRYDKRGVGDSDGSYKAAGFLDNVDDARAAMDFLRRQPGIQGDRVFIAGHSEGALIAAAIAGGDDPPAGAALLAGSAQTGEQVLRRQAAMLPDLLPGWVQRLNKILRVDVEKSQLKRLAKLKASQPDVLRMQGLVKVNAKWFREFMAFDPSEFLKATTVPVLALTGTDDSHVDPGDIALMQEQVQGPFQGQVIAGMNHILRTGGASPTTYRKQLSEPTDPRVLELLTAWIGDMTA
ncbi:MAG: alpha/beta hydrolase [Acidimicrobiia bacterium]